MSNALSQSMHMQTAVSSPQILHHVDADVDIDADVDVGIDADIGVDDAAQKISESSNQVVAQTINESSNHHAVNSSRADPHCAAMAKTQDPVQHTLLLSLQNTLDHQQQKQPVAHSSSCFSATDSALSQDHCKDCNVSFCQSLLLWIKSEIAPLSTASTAENSIHLASAYTAQHLAGYWQEILRPPKA